MGASVEKLFVTAALRDTNAAVNLQRVEKLYVTAAQRDTNAIVNHQRVEKLYVTAAIRGPAVGITESQGRGFAIAHSEVVLAIRPASDDATGTWVNEAAGATLYASINDAGVNDATYIIANAGTANDTARVKLEVPDYEMGDEVYVEYRYAKHPPDATQTVNITVTLKEGTTTIASWTHTNVGTTLTSVIQTLTAPQIAAITNFGNLYLEFVSSPS